MSSKFRVQSSVCRTLLQNDAVARFLKIGFLFFALTCFQFPGPVIGRRRNNRPVTLKSGPGERTTESRPGACLERSKCAFPRDKLAWYELNCFCDDLCTIYDDCCVNFASTSEGMTRPERRNVESFVLSPEVIGCQSFEWNYMLPSTLLFSDNYYLVDRCPRGFVVRVIRESCERGQDSSADTFLRLPVNGRQTRVLYRNIYCALCNNDTDVQYWMVEKGVNEKLNYSASLDILKSKDMIIFTYPKETTLRKCIPVIRECSVDWNDETTAQLCQRYHGTDYKHLDYQTVYRNSFCANCNNVSNERIRCEAFRDPRGTWKPPEAIFPQPSYSLIMDLNQGSGVLRNNKIGSTGTKKKTTEVTFNERCPTGQVYDPFSNVCRLLFCSAGLSVTSDGCSKTTDVTPISRSNMNPLPESVSEGNRSPKLSTQTFNHKQSKITYSTVYSRIWNFSSTSTLILAKSPIPFYKLEADPSESLHAKLSCPQLAFNQSEYVLYENRSAFIYSFSKLYEPNEYTLHESLLYVCSPLNDSSYNVTRNVTEMFNLHKFGQLQGILSSIGVAISLACLFVQFVVYMCYPTLRNVPGKCIVCLVTALFFGQLMHNFVTPRDWFAPACLYFALLMHYVFLAAFFWMNVMAIDICRTFSSQFVRSSSTSSTTSKRFIGYSLYAWLTPAIIVSIGLTLDFTLSPSDNDESPSTWSNPRSWAPRYGDGLCWLTSRTALFAFFALPLGLILITNIILFIVSVCYIQKASKASQPAVKSKPIGRLLLYVKLSFVMGFAWVFGFAASIQDWQILWYLFVFFNSLQGAFICLSFVCTAKVFRLLKNGGFSLPTLNAKRINMGKPQLNRSGEDSNTNIQTKETTMGTDGSDNGKIVSKETAV